ncbi:hypothetical protein [Hylemonella gracilis]|uniref:hypothetical protein n=1 Tax=Hylemonella gracilis TaxID=80880 RepID=UPI00103A99DD|nr:hypothetical protein [Hylemonella gracilis]
MPTSTTSSVEATSANTWQLLGYEFPSPKDTLTATGVLLAFLIGFYTLIGRDRKSPYLTNRLFQILLLCLPAVILCLLAQVFGTSYGWSKFTANILAVSAFSFLVVALVLTFWRIYKIYMRFALFVDSASPKHLSIFRFIKSAYRRFNNTKPWEWTGIPLSETLQAKVHKIINPEGEAVDASAEQPASVAISLSQHGRANHILAELATAFLEDGKLVQYMTASRHPLEFVKYLQNHIGKNSTTKWHDIRSKIVVVDAYTRHFGYADSIYMEATTSLTRNFGVQHVTSGESFAGLHTASSVAFNKIKDQAAKGAGRQPMLVIYEDCYALADLESREQYRVFVRHVVPSERMWEGMFTVFVETAQEAADWGLLASYCDLIKIEKTGENLQ